jgi:adenylate kinase family enzyme
MRDEAASCTCPRSIGLTVITELYRGERGRQLTYNLVIDTQRISVVGNSGSGKSTLARRIAAAIDAPVVELDAMYHQANWTPRDPELFMAEVSAIADTQRWVIDGNYRTVVVDGPVWQRADTVVWLRVSRRTVMRQIVPRTLRRVVSRKPLWNGNREQLSNLFRWNPDLNVIRWAWTQHAKYAERYEIAINDPRYANINFVVLRSRAEANQWLAMISSREVERA